MEISEVGKLYPELKPIIERIGVKKLYPPQEEAIRKGALEKSFLLASGTASGKTLVALLSAARKVLEGKKVLYLAPLRSLAFEKLKEFKELPFRTAISVGEMDSNDPWLGSYDIIVATYEKAESLLRHRPGWLRDVGLVVFDEAHEMARKPLIETLAVKLGWCQMLLLSATIGNVEELASWLGVDFVRSDFRPVPLREGVLDGQRLVWEAGEEELRSKKYGIEGIVEDGLERGQQTLIFTNTRRGAEATAEKAARLVGGGDERLETVAEMVENALDFPTRQCRKLADIIRRGAAFHHAGLVNEQRILVENAFREGLIKVLASTVTLVAGLNLPSRRVVVKNPSFRGEPWPVSLYKQAAGRSGRPGYDERGESIILHSRPGFAMEYFVKGEVEPVRSPLAFEPTLRREIIGLFASGFASSKEDVASFMEKSFYAFQHGDPRRIVDLSLRVVDRLVSWGMLEGSPLRPTKLGRRVAELYIDPYTALVWRRSFGSTSPLGYVHLIGMGNEMDLPRLRGTEMEDLMYSLASRGGELVYPRPDPWDPEFERYLRAFKLGMIIEDWVDEKGEDYILNRFGIAPGDLRNYVRNTEWLAYALSQVVEGGVDLNKLTKRVKHGVRGELVELAELPGIGRVKARKLYNQGITLGNLTKVPREKLVGLVGRTTAERVLKKLAGGR